MSKIASIFAKPKFPDLPAAPRVTNPAEAAARTSRLDKSARQRKAAGISGREDRFAGAKLGGGDTSPANVSRRRLSRVLG